MKEACAFCGVDECFHPIVIFQSMKQLKNYYFSLHLKKELKSSMSIYIT
jgi:hypothetical protein